MASIGSITTRIIKDGLVFNMDPANRACYPKTGTTATDTINSLTGTFSSSPTFDPSEGQGVIDFDDTDNINFGDNDVLDWGSGDGTIGAWCKCASGNGVQDFVMKGAYSTNGKNYTLLLSTNEKLMFAIDDNTTAKSVESATTGNDNTFRYLVGVRDGNNLRFYINGEEDGNSPTDITGYGSLDSTDPLLIGAGTSGAGGSPGNYLNGSVASVHIYNRALSATEVMRNFNALKDRMGYVAPLIVTFLVVGGGGASAGSATAVGGAGAGGLRTSFGSTSGGGASAEDDLTLLPGTSYTVTVGAGASGTSGINAGPRGNDSVFATITSLGGGNGGSGNVDNAGTRETSFPPSDRTKGSGGGAGRNWGTANSIGIGTTGQGMDGNYSRYDGVYTGGGGGGASQDGYRGNHGTYPGGGGDGLAVAITGTSVTYAGGGGGSKWNVGSSAAPGGAGGGGNGGVRNGAAPTDAGANTGGGGGGPRGGASSPDNSSSNGGSGVVILRYPSSKTITAGSGLTSSTSTDGAFKVTTFTAGTDTITFS